MKSFQDLAHLWEDLSQHVQEEEWKKAEHAANALNAFLCDFDRVNGIYKIGFQRLFGAPQKTKEAINKYHEVLEVAQEKSAKRKKKGKKK